MSKRPRPAAYTPAPAAARRAGGVAVRRPAQRNPFLVLGVVGGTVLLLAIILAFAISRGNDAASTATTTPAAGTPGAVTAIPLSGIGVLDPASGLAQPAKQAPKVGQAAPDFAWQSTSGRESLAGLRGHAVLLEFFAPWCPQCQQDVPLLNSLLTSYGARGLQILSVTASPYGRNYEKGSYAPVTTDDLSWYSSLYKTNYPMIFDSASRVFNLYGRGSSYPTFFIIDAKGMVRFSTTLSISNQDLEARVRAALPA